MSLSQLYTNRCGWAISKKVANDKNITTETMKNDIPNSVEIIDSHLDDFFTDEDDIVVFDEGIDDVTARR
ncbi:hypothetical protein GCM10011418_16350 [Sphingobacterium alkalisoli]|uniref:hypothetical protein n=1 Tax=Sphingobacterium alkalisoli TaxID=1874115 RepID=UPI00145DA4EC|nr:hypothetical protein [Sphingobacterium alkalisoli]GGH14991.1 hypothetical protein GCM10011418_16350 [Sphingobacterium alkalisoli]